MEMTSQDVKIDANPKIEPEINLRKEGKRRFEIILIN